eukprot:Pgem_evm1s5328
MQDDISSHGNDFRIQKHGQNCNTINSTSEHALFEVGDFGSPGCSDSENNNDNMVTLNIVDNTVKPRKKKGRSASLSATQTQNEKIVKSVPQRPRTASVLIPDKEAKNIVRKQSRSETSVHSTGRSENSSLGSYGKSSSDGDVPGFTFFKGSKKKKMSLNNEEMVVSFDESKTSLKDAHYNISNGSNSENATIEKSIGCLVSYSSNDAEKSKKPKILKPSDMWLASFYVLLNNNKKHMDALRKIFKKRKVKQGEVIVQKGVATTKLHVIASGSLQVSAGKDVLCESTVGEVINDRFFDVMFDGPLTPGVTITTSENCVLYETTRDNIVDLYSTPGFGVRIAEKLSKLVKKETLKGASGLFAIDLLTHSQRDVLYHVFRTKVLKKGETLYEEGIFQNEMFVVASGSVSEVSNLGNPSYQHFYTYNSGDHLGEFAVCANVPHTYSAVGAEDSVVFGLHGKDVIQFLKFVPNIRKFWKTSYDKTVKNSIINQLKRFNVPFLASFTEEHYSIMAGLTTVKQYPEDTVVFREGDHGNTFYMIAKGEIRVTVKGKTVAKMQSGDYFGEIALVSNIERTATVTTSEMCVLLCCSKSNFKKLTDKLPSMKADFQAHLAPKKMTIRDIIHHDTALHFFTKMLEKEYSDENMKFIQAVTNYRKLQDNSVQQLSAAEEIVQTFMARGSSLPVNIVGVEKLEVQGKLNSRKIDKTLFDNSVEHVMHLLSTDSLSRFKNSNFFNQFTDSLRKYHISDDHHNRTRKKSLLVRVRNMDR